MCLGRDRQNVSRVEGFSRSGHENLWSKLIESGLGGPWKSAWQVFQLNASSSVLLSVSPPHLCIIPELWIRAEIQVSFLFVTIYCHLTVKMNLCFLSATDHVSWFRHAKLALKQRLKWFGMGTKLCVTSKLLLKGFCRASGWLWTRSETFRWCFKYNSVRLMNRRGTVHAQHLTTALVIMMAKGSLHVTCKSLLLKLWL